MKKITLLLILCIWFSRSSAQNALSLASPNQQLKISVKAGNTLDSLLTYAFNVNGTSVIKRGSIGVSMQTEFTKTAWRVDKVKQSSKNQTWKPAYGERSTVTDNYNELVISFKPAGQLRHKVTVWLRLYNEGFAYKYELSNGSSDSLTLAAEHSAFTFAGNHTAWVTKTAQGLISPKPINDITEASERPLTVKLNDSLYAALGEAGLADFARMKFVKGGENTLSSLLYGSVVQQSAIKSPWRYVLVGKSPGELLEKNFLVLNLNEPSKIKNTSWIKPGKVIREPSLTTAGSILSIDFAAKHNIPYVSFDAGWYGKEDSDTADASRVALDPARSKGPLDLPAVIKYADSKNVGIILYVNRRALERQLDILLPLYKKWGIKGIKFGFVQVGSQKWTSWLHDAIRKCAEYNMVVDVHDEYRPTGYTHTYPNLLTQEGVRGDEESPTNSMILNTLFTRMIAGPADQTNAYFTKRVDKMGSHGSQMAKAICIYSPLQFIYWYDRPASPNGNPTAEGVIQELPDLKFYDELPTVWNDTRILEGQIGEYATVARKNGDQWFIGSLTGDDSRKVNIKCSFLDPGKSYTAFIYSDDVSSTSPTKIKLEKVVVNSNSGLSYLINKNNGLAIRLVPANK